jgi:hypothetical protein
MHHSTKCKAQPIKLLEDNTGENPDELENDDDLLDITQKACSLK